MLTMTVQYYISRDRNGNERGFEFPYERDAALQVAKSLWKAYGYSKKTYALVANIVDPPIDLAIVSSDGLGIVDMKDCTGRVIGTINTPWDLVDDRGRKIRTVLAGASHLNPFRQVQKYRDIVQRDFERFAQSNFVSRTWKMSRPFIQGCVLFTASRFDASGIIFSTPEKRVSWFSLHWLDEIDEWAQTLSFGSNLHLSDPDIQRLVDDFFKAKPWTEIEDLVKGRQPFGFLVYGGTEDRQPFPLSEMETNIGREKDNMICVGAKYDRVSRHHATVIRRLDSTFLVDNESRHGTFVNGSRIASEHRLIIGDRIVLGGCDADGGPKEGACLFIYQPYVVNAARTVESSNGPSNGIRD
jgi:hypothetical protein